MKKKRVPGWFVIVILVLIGAIGFSGYKVVSIWLEYKKADDEYANLQELVHIDRDRAMRTDGGTAPAEAASAIASDAPAPGQSPARPDEGTAGSATPSPGESPSGSETAQTASTDAAQPTASATPRPQILVDFTPLLEINGDAIAWIYSEGTVIDYPIVQGGDNAFYLDHLFSGGWGSAGAIFMDVDNAADFTDANTVVYGHHMNNGSMFASLSNYRDQEYYEQHPTMHLYTPIGDYTIEIFSGYVRDASAIPHDFDTPEDFVAYVDMVRGLSNFRSDVAVEEGDRIITLSTCSYVTDNARYVVHGKLVPLYE